MLHPQLVYNQYTTHTHSWGCICTFQKLTGAFQSSKMTEMTPVMCWVVYQLYTGSGNSISQEKMTMRPFKAKGYRAKEFLDLVHTDLCGPMSTNARGGYEYFIIFIDDYSRYGYIYLMRHKSEAFDKFKEFKAEVENYHGRSIKSLRSDH